MRSSGRTIGLLVLTLIVLATGVAGAASPAFKKPVPYPVSGSDPWGIASADFNHDGRPDLVTGNFNDGTFSVLANTGGGKFASPTTLTGTGANPSTMAVGRLNGDSDPDIVAGTSGSASVFLGGPGTTFSPRAPYGSYGASQARGIAVGDFNGDGKLDVALSADTKELIQLPGNGDGTFNPQLVTALGSHDDGDLAAGKLNGDKRSDVVMASSGKRCVGLFLGSTKGTGFKPPRYLRGPGPTCDAVAIGDVNGDHRPDIVAAGGGTENRSGGSLAKVRTLLAKKGGGYKALKTGTTGGESADDLALADLDRDGSLDLVVTNSNGKLSIMRGKGNGRFGRPLVVKLADCRSAVVARLNGDKRPDIAASGGGANKVFVLLQKG